MLRASAIVLAALFVLGPLSSVSATHATLDGHPKMASDWRVGYEAQGAGAWAALMIVTDGTNLTNWVESRDGIWYVPSEQVPVLLATVPFDAVATLLRMPQVKHVDFDRPMEFHMATSTMEIGARDGVGRTGLWHVDEDGFVAPADLERPVTGAGIRVAVLDSGIDETHPDFGGFDCQGAALEPACDSRVVTKVKFDQLRYWPLDVSGLIPGAGLGDHVPTTDFTSGHGTHVAGTIAGNGHASRASSNPSDGADGLTIGVAPEAEIVSIGIGVGPWAGGSLAAMGWVVDNHEQYNIKVTSNSYGCTGGCAYNAGGTREVMVKALYDRGIVSVWSNGNSYGTGSGAEMNGDAQIPYVIGTAAYSDVSQQLASFSSRGSAEAALTDPATWTPEGEGSDPPRRPDIAAPGVSIQSAAGITTSTRGAVGSDYIAKSGTSMAAPHVSGVLALSHDACPDATAVDRMRAIFASADAAGVLKTSAAPGDTATDDWSHGSGAAEPFEAGYGALRARAAIEWLWDNVCPANDLRIDAQYILGAVQFAPTGIEVPQASTVRGLPDGLTFDGARIVGTAYDPGTYLLDVQGPAGLRWETLIVEPGQLPSPVDVEQGIVGQGDAFGLTETVQPMAMGTAFLRQTTDVTAHIAVCGTDCTPPGAGIPVGFVRGVGPEDASGELRMQQSLPIGADVRTIALARGPVTLTIEAGAYQGGARLWIPDGSQFGYEPVPSITSQRIHVIQPGQVLQSALTWEPQPDHMAIVSGPPHTSLEGGTLTARATTDFAVWVAATKDDVTAEHAIRIVVNDGTPEAAKVIAAPSTGIHDVVVEAEPEAERPAPAPAPQTTEPDVQSPEAPPPIPPQPPVERDSPISLLAALVATLGAAAIMRRRGR